VKTDSPIYVVTFTAVISIAFTAAVMTVQVATADRIARNEALRDQKALVEVFDLGDTEAMSAEEIADVVDRRIETAATKVDPKTGRSFDIVRAYRTDKMEDRERSDDDLIGVAFPVSGNGFWAPIAGLMALTPDLNKVIGLVFLEEKETPGLGGRITEAEFQNAFEGLDVSPPPEGAKFINIAKESPTDPNDPRYGRSVDAITGATQTSMAVEKFLNANLRQFRRAMAATK